jgi:hypothetical protein
MGSKKENSRAEIAKKVEIYLFDAFVGSYPLFLAYFGALTVTKAGLSTRSATV